MEIEYNNYKLVEFAGYPDHRGIRIGNQHDDWYYINLKEYEESGEIHCLSRHELIFSQINIYDYIFPISETKIIKNRIENEKDCKAH